MANHVGEAGPDNRTELDSEDRTSRGRSSIAFPYVALDEAIPVARQIHERAGDSLSPAQLAAYLSHDTVESGAFRMKIYAAKLFGLIRTERSKIFVTDLGRQINEQRFEQQARVNAFLSVPLYRKVFEKYDGYQLPGDSALESVLVSLGIAEKQKARARQVFQKSAQQAGFFANGRDRLLAPVARTGSPVPDSQNEPADEQNVSPNVYPVTDLMARKPPLLVALFNAIPDEGAPWDSESRDKWILTAKSILDLIYRP